MRPKLVEDFNDKDASSVRNAIRTASHELEVFIETEVFDSETLEEIVATLRHTRHWLSRLDYVAPDWTPDHPDRFPR
jgi:hypothetical protein